MASSLTLDYGITGQTVYALIFDDAGAVWNGTAFVVIASANWSTYAVAMTEKSTTGIYEVAVPALVAGVYSISYRLRAGVSPATTDTVIGDKFLDWNGTATTPAALLNAYCTLAQLKANISITDTNDDTRLNSLIAAASRSIDKQTGRCFVQVPSVSTEVRYFNAIDRDKIFVDDLISVSGLATDESRDQQFATIWSASDYLLAPYNAAAMIEPEPYLSIERSYNGNHLFPIGCKTIKLTGVWGWSAVPSLITQAALLQAHRWFKRPDAIFGIMGSADMGQVMVLPKLDPDVTLMIKNYIRRRKLV